MHVVVENTFYKEKSRLVQVLKRYKQHTHMRNKPAFPRKISFQSVEINHKFHSTPATCISTKICIMNHIIHTQ